MAASDLTWNVYFPVAGGGWTFREVVRAPDVEAAARKSIYIHGRKRVAVRRAGVTEGPLRAFSLLRVDATEVLEEEKVLT